MSFNILALDGGGIRGYMSARILMKLEEDTGASLTDKALVDGYCGTSTGGLLALGFTVGKTPEEMATLYRKHAPEIFTPNQRHGWAEVLKAVLRLVGLYKQMDVGMGVFESRYTSTNLARFIETIVGDMTFGDIPKGRLLAINAASMEVPGSRHGWRACTFSNYPLDSLCPHENDTILADTRGVRLLDGALATSAAPGYFPPHHVSNGGAPLGYFADGGTFANNPIVNGFQVANGPMQIDDDHISILSIGTGANMRGIPETAVFDDPESFGILDWLGLKQGVPSAALLDMILSCTADNMTSIADSILGKRVVRLDPELDQPIPLDGIDAASFAEMDKAVEKVVNTTSYQKAIALIKAWQTNDANPKAPRIEKDSQGMIYNSA